jgi:hypothetical protein
MPGRLVACANRYLVPGTQAAARSEAGRPASGAVETADAPSDDPASVDTTSNNATSADASSNDPTSNAAASDSATPDTAASNAAETHAPSPDATPAHTAASRSWRRAQATHQPPPPRRKARNSGLYPTRPCLERSPFLYVSPLLRSSLHAIRMGTPLAPRWLLRGHDVRRRCDDRMGQCQLLLV